MSDIKVKKHAGEAQSKRMSSLWRGSSLAIALALGAGLAQAQAPGRTEITEAAIAAISSSSGAGMVETVTQRINTQIAQDAHSHTNTRNEEGFLFWAGTGYHEFEGQVLSGLDELKGDSRGFRVGFDLKYAPDRIIGIALNHSRSDVDTVDTSNNAFDLEASSTSVYPYIHLSFGEGATLWGMLGYGEGSVSYDANNQAGDLQSKLLAGGFSKTLNGYDHVFDLRLKASGLYIEDSVDAIETTEAINAVGEANADAFRLNMSLELAYNCRVGEQGVWSTVVDFGSRLDSGDVDDGFGLETKIHLSYKNLGSGLRLSGRFGTVVLHSEGAVQDQDVSISIGIDPDIGGQGLSLSVEPGMGYDSSLYADVSDLWQTSLQAQALSGHSASLHGARSNQDAYLTMKMAYGFNSQGMVISPFTELNFRGGRSAAKAGLRFDFSDAVNEDLNLEVYAQHLSERTTRDSGVFATLRWSM